MPEPVTLLGLGGGMMGMVVYLARRYFELAKEVMDILLGVVLLALVLPVIATCALLIRISSPGPVIFRQMRLGKDGKPFWMYKLRTMHPDAEKNQGATWAARNDPRVIPACRWMRRSHLDELPQLVNVIKGDMSIVGPRPERPEIMSKLKHDYPNVDTRLSVKPGITGLAQIRGGYDTSIKNFSRKLDADLEYIASRRWSLEFWILAKTVSKFNDTNAH